MGITIPERYCAQDERISRASPSQEQSTNTRPQRGSSCAPTTNNQPQPAVLWIVQKQYGKALLFARAETFAAFSKGRESRPDWQRVAVLLPSWSKTFRDPGPYLTLLKYSAVWSYAETPKIGESAGRLTPFRNADQTELEIPPSIQASILRKGGI